MEYTTMKKSAYKKPTCKVMVLQHKAIILVVSPKKQMPPDDDIPEYDDWME